MQLARRSTRWSAADAIVGDSPPMRKVLELVQHVAPDRRHGADPRRERHRQGDHRPRDPRQQPAALLSRSCRSTAARCPRACSRASSSATRRAPSPAPSTAARARSRWPTAARSSSTRWGPSAPKMQVDLLRVLETKELDPRRRHAADQGRLPGRSARPTRTSKRAVEEGRFREDFYYRINVFTIELPPLRDRRVGHPGAGRALPRTLRPADGQADHRHQPRRRWSC